MTSFLKAALFTLALIFFTGAQLEAQNHKQQQKYLPKPLKKLWFGMSMEAFSRMRKHLPSDQLGHEEFRYRWLETFGKKGPIDAVIYYFGEKEDKPLYEIVIFYRDVSARTRFLEKYFGPPNHDSVEWKLGSGEGFIIRAWNHEERLVIIAELEGTEWEPK